MRVKHWEDRLFEFAVTRQAMPFAWGTNDCASMAADWIGILTGTRPELPAYEATEFSAMRVIAEGGGLRELISRALSLPAVVDENRLRAQRGDIALVPMIDNPEHEATGVVVGQWVLVPSWEGGLLYPITDITAAWRIE